MAQAAAAHRHDGKRNSTAAFRLTKPAISSMVDFTRRLIGTTCQSRLTSTVGGVMVILAPSWMLTPTGILPMRIAELRQGVFPKVIVNAQGHVNEGAALAEDDVPPLSNDKITSGELPTARLGDRR